MRRAKRGFWDEELRAQVDASPFPSAEEEFFAEEEEPAEHCTHDDLYEAMGSLTARQNFVVRLFYGIECEAMTLQQIAVLMGIHHSTVREHLFVAQGKLRAYLDTPQNDI